MNSPDRIAEIKARYRKFKVVEYDLVQSDIHFLLERVAQLETALSTAHKVFGAESDTLSSIIKKQELFLQKRTEAINTALMALGTGDCTVNKCAGCEVEIKDAIRTLKDALKESQE